ncbi:MAG: 1,4-alpha-glucan branching protein GlgB [Pseudomonadota bacterium]
MPGPPAAAPLPPALQRLIQGCCHEPHAWLGPHEDGDRFVVRAWLPGARRAWLHTEAEERPMTPIADGLFVSPCKGRLACDYRLRWRDADGGEHEHADSYAFPFSLDAADLADFSQGRLLRAWRLLGAHPITCEGVAGTRFSVWAPNAERVSVIGDFNDWDARRHLMSVHGESGVWETFLPGVGPGALYKFEMRVRDTGECLVRTDPYGRSFERRPLTAARVTADPLHVWTDHDWMRARPDWREAPMAIYEVHPGSWRRRDDGGFLDYRELARQLTDYLADTGFTHVELLPVTEHPHDPSWGYQSTGFFAPTSRYGEPDEFRAFVDWMHRHGYGVILDWVPGHFPRDEGALARFDGTALYEHADPQRAGTPDWGTLHFNFERLEVRSFLLSSALYWLEEFHLDGLRVDAVAAMLYLDFGRSPGHWSPNAFGGREDLAAVTFLREMNIATHGQCPGTFTIAEESSAWPAVTRPAWLGGLGFSMKWNMGWMHDTLGYFARDPVHRSYHHDALTFGRLYAFDENFVLPFSHDEVVHGKGTLLGRMPGDRWQRFANLRLLLALQFTWPGKKLLFMGQEFGVQAEWDEQRALDWAQAEQPEHAALRRLVADLSRLYRSLPALHRGDFDAQGFDWIDCHDAPHSVISFLRRHRGQHVAVVLNCTPVPRHGYRLGLPVPGRWRERLNTDSHWYGGSDMGNGGVVVAGSDAWQGLPCSAQLSLPPLAALVLEWEAA